jgi:hypothetical protein
MIVEIHIESNPNQAYLVSFKMVDLKDRILKEAIYYCIKKGIFTKRFEIPFYPYIPKNIG